MLPVLVNAPCEIIRGPLKGTKGRVIAFNAFINEVQIELDEYTTVVTIHEYIEQ